MSESDFWVFGYGSLVWRPAFPFIERVPGVLHDWSRRYWQGSTDHRGVPKRPGRVVTLVPEAGAECWGVVYRVGPADRDAVLETLDHRERGGFERHELEVRFHGPTGPGAVALVYVATDRNPNYLGPAPLDEIAAQIERSVGPSGSNVEYALFLAESLRELGASDSHVFDVAARLNASR
jgi:cation transport regulator ChaC